MGHFLFGSLGLKFNRRPNIVHFSFRKVVKSPETKFGKEINIEEEDDSEDELGGNSLVKKPMDDYEDL